MLENIDQNLWKTTEMDMGDYDFESAFGSIEDMVESVGEGNDNIGGG